MTKNLNLSMTNFWSKIAIGKGDCDQLLWPPADLKLAKLILFGSS